MKTFLKLTVALFAFGFATLNAAELSEGAKAAIVEVVATAKEGNKEDTIEAVRVACKNFPDAAPDIVSAVITALGGNDADPAFVAQIVATAISAASEFSEQIVAAAIGAAPNLATQINVSADGGGAGGDPLNQAGGGGNPDGAPSSNQPGGGS